MCVQQQHPMVNDRIPKTSATIANAFVWPPPV
jgi:hypothetical protein